MSGLPPYEQSLLEDIARGSETAFKVIFDRHYDRLFEYMLALTKSPQVAEEIASDVFVKMWTGRELLPGIQNFEAFLMRVARNKAMDFFDVTARNARYQKAIFDAIKPETSQSADYRLLDQEAQTLLTEVLATLSVQRRLVFTMHRIEGLSHEEIAQQLNLSHQTVKNTMVAAQRSLRQLVKRKYPDGILMVLLYLITATGA